jgi:DNA-binding NarL/FixJ family response regulator
MALTVALAMYGVDCGGVVKPEQAMQGFLAGAIIVKPPKLSPYRILVVDDFEPFRHFVSTMLQNQSGLQIIGEASDGAEAVQKAQHFQPDLILLDIALPTMNGIEAARQIREISPLSKILFVSTDCSADVAEKALSAGGDGYVTKLDASIELLPGIETVVKGKRFVSASLPGHEHMTSLPRVQEGEHPSKNSPFSEFLASVIEATAADFGTVQLFDSANHVLRIVAQHGFEGEFLDYFATVGYKDDCVCGKAMNGLSRIVVQDVATDSLFSNESRGVLLRAKVGSVQSTPLINSLGKFVGVLTTHYSRPGSYTPDVLRHVDDLTDSFLAKLNTMRATYEH